MKRRRPLWRAFCCLLLGGLAWWLVAWGLEPRPRWSAAPEAGYYWKVLAEWPEHNVVAVQILMPESGGRNFILQLLDRRTGAQLKSSAVIGPVAYRVSNDPYPHLVHGALWCQDYHVIENRNHLRFMRWEIEGHAEAVPVYTCQDDWVWRPDMLMPQGSDLLIVERRFDWNACLPAHLNYPYGLLLMGGVLGSLNKAVQPSVNTCYRLPRQSGQPLVKLRHWVGFRPSSYYSSYAWVEGQTLQAQVYPPRLKPPTPLGRARALGKLTLTPAELAWCFLGEGNRVRLTEVVTGQVLAELPPLEAGAYSYVWWVGPYLFTRIQEWQVTKPMSVQELTTLQENLWTNRLKVFRWDGKSLQPVTLVGEEEWHRLSYLKQHDRLTSYQILNEERERDIRWMSFQERDNTLELAQHVKLPDSESVPVSDPTGTQVFVNLTHCLPYSAEIYSWAETRPWLKQLLRRIKLQRSDVVVYSTQNGQVLHRMAGHIALNGRIEELDLPSLYTWTRYLDSDEKEKYTLHCYSLPLRIYSPWWPRIAGLLTALVCWLLLTRRARRGVV